MRLLWSIPRLVGNACGIHMQEAKVLVVSYQSTIRPCSVRLPRASRKKKASDGPMPSMRVCLACVSVLPSHLDATRPQEPDQSHTHQSNRTWLRHTRARRGGRLADELVDLHVVFACGG